MSMMARYAPTVEIESVIITHLAQVLPGVKVADRVDASPLLVVVMTTGGGRAGRRHETAQVSLDCYAASGSLGDAARLAVKVADAIQDLASQTVGGVHFHRVNITSRPHADPHPSYEGSRYAFSIEARFGGPVS